MSKRKVPQLTFAQHPDYGRKCWISLSGCNFDCKGCISTAKQGIGRAMSVEELIDLILKSCEIIWGKDTAVSRVAITGGEPLLNEDYLITLIKELKKLSIAKFELSTNAYLLDEDLLNRLFALDVDILFKPDLKAYDKNIHMGYTGKSNANVLKAIELLSKHKDSLPKRGPSFVVRTVYMPGIVGINEIQRIAEFLGKTDKNACYRIQQFSPAHGLNVTRRPNFKEMMRAYNIARGYLDYVIISTYLPTRVEYNYVEIRADELRETFNAVDRKSKSIINSWNVRYFTMNQVLKKSCG